MENFIFCAVIFLSVFLVINCPLTYDVMNIQSYINLSLANVPFLYIVKTFSGGIEIKHWYEISEALPGFQL